MRKSYLAVLIALLLTISTLTTPSMALSAGRVLNAFYGVQILYDQKVLNSNIQPFIVDGTTYVPLRMLIEAFDDKKIFWDGVNSRVLIEKVQSAKEKQYETRIAELEAQISELKKQTGSGTPAAAFSTNSIESALDRKYYLFEDLDAEFSVEGSADAVEVTMKTATGKWLTLSDSNKTILFKGICAEVWADSSTAKVTGYIKDGSTELYRFSFRQGDTVTYEGFKLSDITHDLNTKYGDYYDADLDFSLSGDVNRITMNISVSDNDWNSLYKYDHGTIMLDICNFIWSKVPDADIKGYVKDRSDTLYRFDTTAIWPDVSNLAD